MCLKWVAITSRPLLFCIDFTWRLPDNSAHWLVFYNLKETRNLTSHVLFFEWQYSLNFRNLFCTHSCVLYGFCSHKNLNQLIFRYSKRKLVKLLNLTLFILIWFDEKSFVPKKCHICWICWKNSNQKVQSFNKFSLLT